MLASRNIFFFLTLLSALLVVDAIGDTSGPIGTWYLKANTVRLTATLTSGPQPGTYRGTLIRANGGTERLDNISWDATTRRLEFRRIGNGFWQWYRGIVVEGILVGRFSHNTQSSGRPTQLTTYVSHVTGWNRNYLETNIAPRVYEVLLNNDYRGRLRIDYCPDCASQYAGRLKVYSTKSGGARGEEVEYDLQVTQWDGTNLRFIRRNAGWTQVYTGVTTGRNIAGTFTHSGLPGNFPWNGQRAEVLSYGFIPKPYGRLAWQQRTRRQLFHLMMGGNPKPVSRNITTLRSNFSPIPVTQLPLARDDNPGNWPQNYRLTELQFDYTLPNPYGGQPIPRRSHAYLAVPTSPPPASGKFPTVLALNGHGESAWEVMNPNSGYWYGDAFARRGFVVLAVDISHRVGKGDDPEHGNVAHPPIQATGFDSDWEEDGERTWDAMRGLDYLLSLPNVDANRVLVTGLSMGGEITMLVGALDTRIALSIPAGYSPDMGVMIEKRNHACFLWSNADIREYVDISDFYALTAPRALIIQTGKADDTFSLFQPPFAADKQVARRTRAAYGRWPNPHRFIHYLHYDDHNYHIGDINPTIPTDQGVRIPEVIEPTAPWSVEWQVDGRVNTENSTLFDYVTILNLMDPPDPDRDGLTSEEEASLAGTYPCLSRFLSDSDRDGINDGDEVNIWGTSPCERDTDGDRMDDRLESDYECLNPLVADADLDPDDDGLTNAEEINNIGRRSTDPCNSDPDGDDYSDLEDNCPYISNSDQRNLDGDGRGDVCDDDIDGDGCPNRYDPNPANINNPTTSAQCRREPILDFIKQGRLVELFDESSVFNDPRIRSLIEGDRPPICGTIECPASSLKLFDGITQKMGPEIRPADLGFGENQGFVSDVQGLPDLDMDGTLDIAIGVPNAAPTADLQQAGAVVIVSGKTGAELGRIQGRVRGAVLGTTLALRDKNTLAIGAPGIGEMPGAVHLAQLSNFSIARVISVNEEGDEFGTSIETIDDLDGDGISELFIGAPNSEETGAVYSFTSTGELEKVGQGNAPGDRFGFAIVSSGDVEGDCNREVLIGAPGAGNQAGQVTLMNFTGERLWSQVGREEGERFGYDLSVLLKDSVDTHLSEFLVGAPGWRQNTGRVFALTSEGELPTHIISGRYEGAALGTYIAVSALADQPDRRSIVLYETNVEQGAETRGGRSLFYKWYLAQDKAVY